MKHLRRCALALLVALPMRYRSFIGTSHLHQGSRLHMSRRGIASQQGGDVSQWPTRELRLYLEKRKIRHQDCFEKIELVDRVKDAMAKGITEGSASPSPATSATSATGSSPRTPPQESTRRFLHFGELVEIPSLRAEEGVFIFLHGFGDSARGFVSQLPNLLQLPSVRYVLPTAPSLGGMRSWFTQAALGGAAPGSAAVKDSVDYVHYLIRQQISRGVPGKKIFVGGFSQGGSIAVQAALSFPDATLGGVVAASTFLSLGGGRSPVRISEPNRRLKVLGCHGDADGAVPISAGRDLVETLKSQGVPADFKSYRGMGHAYCPEEALDVTSFIRQQLKRSIDPKDLAAMSAKELKALLLENGVSTLGCFEKADLLERASALA